MREIQEWEKHRGRVKKEKVITKGGQRKRESNNKGGPKKSVDRERESNIEGELKKRK